MIPVIALCEMAIGRINALVLNQIRLSCDVVIGLSSPTRAYIMRISDSCTGYHLGETPPPPSSIIGGHQLVVLHPARKLLLPQRRRVRPRLQPVLLADRRRETARPLLPRVMLHHVLDRSLVHQLCVAAHVVFHIVSAPSALIYLSQQ